MVGDGLSTVEREFLADVMTPNGQTVGDILAPELEVIGRSGKVPALMPGDCDVTFLRIGQGGNRIYQIDPIAFSNKLG